jgi:hypothetical protein
VRRISTENVTEMIGTSTEREMTTETTNHLTNTALAAVIMMIDRVAVIEVEIEIASTVTDTAVAHPKKSTTRPTNLFHQLL